MFSHSFSNLWLIIQHARSHGQWAGCWGIFIVAALRCIEKHCIVLHGIALHYIETHPGSIRRSSSHREEMSRNAMKHGSVASITLMSCCGSWVTSFWGFLILCFRIFTIESKCWNKHILNLDEFEMRHKRERWWCGQCSGVRCGDGNFGIFDLQSRVKAVRRLQLGIL